MLESPRGRYRERLKHATLATNRKPGCHDTSHTCRQTLENQTHGSQGVPVELAGADSWPNLLQHKQKRARSGNLESPET